MAVALAVSWAFFATVQTGDRSQHALAQHSRDGRRQRERAAAGAGRRRGRRSCARVQVGRVQRAAELVHAARATSAHEPVHPPTDGERPHTPQQAHTQGHRVYEQQRRLCQCAVPQLGPAPRPGRLRRAAAAAEGQRTEVGEADIGWSAHLHDTVNIHHTHTHATCLARRFKAIMRTDSGWDGIGYTRSFDTVAGEWQTIDLPFSEFVPVFRWGMGLC